MTQPETLDNRRNWLRRSVGCVLTWGGVWLPQVQAQEARSEKTILSISGHLSRASELNRIDFSLSGLQQLPQHSLVTRTPWYPQPQKFTGVLLKDLLAAVGAIGQQVEVRALNDYKAEIPSADWLTHNALVAYWRNDQPMTVREKGPLVIIYPFDDRPALHTAVYYGRAVWQLRWLEVK